MEGGVDRLSELPDEVFLQILSKLKDDRKSLYRICSLSKQWLNLPASFAQDFVYDSRHKEGGEYFTNHNDNDNDNISDYKGRRHSHRMHSLLSQIRKVAKIGKLEYTYKLSRKERFFQYDLFKLARDRDVRCLILHVYGCTRGVLSCNGPSCLRKFTSLTTLHLTYFCLDFGTEEPLVPVTMTVRTLVLVDCLIRDQLSCDFSRSWPNLEELQMVGCRLRGFQGTVKILCGSKLAKLTMESNMFACCREILGDGVKWFRFVQQFSLFQVLPELKLQSLEHAEVDVSYHIRRDPTLELNLNELISLMWSDEEDQDDCRAGVCLSLFDLLRGLGNAEFLSLSPATVQVLSEVLITGLVEDQPSLFRRLQFLKLEGNLISSFQQEIPDEVKTYLLRDCPFATIIY